MFGYFVFCRLSVGLLPIRLHLDQRHIDFCIEFFSPRQSSSAGGLSPEDGGYPIAGAQIVGSPELPPDANGLVEDALLPFFQVRLCSLVSRLFYLSYHRNSSNFRCVHSRVGFQLEIFFSTEKRQCADLRDATFYCPRGLSSSPS